MAMMQPHRAVAQMVARFVRDEEAVGSNPAGPTKISSRTEGIFVALNFKSRYRYPGSDPFKRCQRPLCLGRFGHRRFEEHFA